MGSFLKLKHVVYILTTVLYTVKLLRGHLTAKTARSNTNCSPSAHSFRFLIYEWTGSGHIGDRIEWIT
jgi:hypothetical protein